MSIAPPRPTAAHPERADAPLWRLETLDLLRGLAALAVVAGHARAYTIQSYAELQAAAVPAGIGTKLFYLATGLGHEAVIVFFALSGFLVGGKALEDLLAGRFAWGTYLLRRLTRLWIVLLPALALGLALDAFGRGLTGGVGYDGRWGAVFASGPGRLAPMDMSAHAFLGNIVFLQTILVPTFGSNDPLWSLANEFWYYIIFPLAAWVIMGRSSLPRRLAGLILLACIVAWLPWRILAPGAIWVAGAVAAWLSRRDQVARLLDRPPAKVAAVALLCAALASTKLPRLDPGDLTLGLIVAVTLPPLAFIRSPGRLWSRVSRFLSEISYTLYLTHFPLLTLVVLAGLGPTRLPPGPQAVPLYAGLLVASLAWATLLWWLFERHTDRVFAYFRRALFRRPGRA